jgi:hypothetical protein
MTAISGAREQRTKSGKTLIIADFRVNIQIGSVNQPGNKKFEPIRTEVKTKKLAFTKTFIIKDYPFINRAFSR